MQTPLPSLLISVLLKMGSVVYSTGKIMKKSQIYIFRARSVSCCCWYYVSRLFPNYGYADPTPLKSGHLDIRDAQCANKNDRRKISYHIISRLGAMGRLKERFRHPNIQLSSQVAKSAGYIGIDLTLIFCINDFLCAFF